MQIIHTASFLDQAFASDAHIFSTHSVNRDTVSYLLFAQLVVAAKWLGQFPAFIVSWHDECRHFTQIYEDVKLVHHENWDIIDKSNAFLLNSGMYQLCKSENEPFFHLQTSTADELRNLFEAKMFVVAAAGHAA